jgi:uncharacterized repeat protein (TIGR01451 family)
MRRAPCLLAVAAASCAALTAAASAHAVAVPRVDLAIVSKTANVTVAHPHQVIKFTIVATNNGPDVAQSLDVADLVDSRRNSGLRFVFERCDQGVSPDTPFCEYSDIAPGETVTTIVNARVIRDHGVVRNRACASSETEVVDTRPGNDCRTTTLRVTGG